MAPIYLNTTQPVLPMLASAPSGVPTGYQYYDTADQAAYVWNGEEWLSLGGGGGSSVWLGGGFTYADYGGGPFTLAAHHVGLSYPPWGSGTADVPLRAVRGNIKPKTLYADGYGTAGTLVVAVRRLRSGSWSTIATLTKALPSNAYWSASVDIDPNDLQDGDWISLNTNSNVTTSLLWEVLT